jgi:hypothetical protein
MATADLSHRSAIPWRVGVSGVAHTGLAKAPVLRGHGVLRNTPMRRSADDSPPQHIQNPPSTP